MKLIDAINGRRSIRKFKGMDVPNEKIEDLINCARLAPSAKNRQPWKFVVVKDDMKNKIADMMVENEKNSADEQSSANGSVISTANIMKEAPVLILALKPNDNDWVIGDTLSIGGAIEHICLRATALDLGSLWIRDIVYTQKEIAKLINYEDMEVISAISIGYPDQNPNLRPRKRLDEILEWYEDEK